MEYTSPSLPPSPCLRSLKTIRVSQYSNTNYLPRECVRPRTGHGLHHEKATRIRIRSADVTVAHSGSATDKGRPKSKAAQCEHTYRFSHLKHLAKIADYNLERTVLEFHDPRSLYGRAVLLILGLDIS